MYSYPSGKSPNTELNSMNSSGTIDRIALNSKDACSYLGINRNLLDSFRRAGLIRYLKAGRLFLYPVAELNSFVQKNIGNEITKDGIVLGGRR